jgi:aminoglycoside 6'-N-acetyltransferase
MKLRRALPGDADTLARWQREPHVLAAASDWEWDWRAEVGRDLEWRELLVAQLDGRPIGFVQVIDPAREESHYWGDVPEGLRAIDIWIGDKADLGKGHGTRMMRLAIERCFADPAVTAIVIDPLASNTRSHRFYERLGFRFVENRSFGGDRCAIYRLDRP